MVQPEQQLGLSKQLGAIRWGRGGAEHPHVAELAS